jgi:methylenetetrahydrofolate reductase (NADPH)
MAALTTATDSAQQRRPAASPLPSAVASFLRGYSIEVTSRSRTAVAACRDSLDPGTQVYIAAIPGDSYHNAVATAAELARSGFVPVPHVAARNIASFTQLNDFLARLRGEAGVDRALVIGGDAEHPVGPYGSALSLLQTGAFQKQNVRRVGIACYPEPNARLGKALLDQALADKIAFAKREGFDAWLVTQFCFDAAPILACTRQLRAGGVTLPLRVGLTGPADIRTIWKYALHCGIGNSMRALGTRVDAISNLLVRHTPDTLVERLAEAGRADPSLDLGGVHFFAFGGIAATGRWARTALDRAPLSD